VDASATSILNQLNSSDLDWDQVAAAATYAESGVQELQDAISGQPPDTERLRRSLADTIAHVEERLQGKQLSPTAREQLTKQLQILRDIEPK
jgi:predicted component of type VI protein secretion system